MNGLKRLNALSKEDARRELLRCCACARWAAAMASSRPFKDEAQLWELAQKTWEDLAPQDWREAFAGHPRIGEDALKEKFAATSEWSRAEQSKARGADEVTLKALAEGNRAYEAKFGHTFIVCATGKSAGEMLATLKRRLANGAREELKAAAAEQLKITRLRLKRLLEAAP